MPGASKFKSLPRLDGPQGFGLKALEGHLGFRDLEEIVFLRVEGFGGGFHCGSPRQKEASHPEPLKRYRALYLQVHG